MLLGKQVETRKHIKLALNDVILNRPTTEINIEMRISYATNITIDFFSSIVLPTSGRFQNNSAFWFHHFARTHKSRSRARAVNNNVIVHVKMGHG